MYIAQVTYKFKEELTANTILVVMLSTHSTTLKQSGHIVMQQPVNRITSSLFEPFPHVCTWDGIIRVIKGVYFSAMNPMSLYLNLALSRTPIIYVPSQKRSPILFSDQWHVLFWFCKNTWFVRLKSEGYRNKTWALYPLWIGSLASEIWTFLETFLENVLKDINT